MKTKLYIFAAFACFLASVTGMAQCTVTGDLNFTSQSALDAWTPPCGQITVEGYLNIQGTDFTDTSKLQNIVQVNSFLQFKSTNLTSLADFANITIVGGSMVIRDCDNLITIPQLSISSIGTDLDIRNNDVLQDMSGLSSITSVTGKLLVRDNAALPALTGLQNLGAAPGGQIYINNNTVLNNISALNYGPLNERLDIVANPALTNVNGLTAITSISNGNLYLQNNTALADLSGLSNLTSISGGGLYVLSNTSLASLDGLSSLASVEMDIQITGNSNLDSFCGLNTLITSGAYGSLSISGNMYNPEASNFPDNCADPLSTDKNFLLNKVSVYPTLADQTLFVKFGEANYSSCLLEVYTLTGNKVANAQAAVFNGTATLEVSLLSPGMYLLNVQTENGAYQSKFIKK